jgi:hypothetical protein
MRLLDIKDNRQYILEISISEMRILHWALIIYCKDLEARSQNLARTNHLEYLEWLKRAVPLRDSIEGLIR